MPIHFDQFKAFLSKFGYTHPDLNTLLSCPEIACQKTIQNDNKCEKKIKTSPQERPAL